MLNNRYDSHLSQQPSSPSSRHTVFPEMHDDPFHGYIAGVYAEPTIQVSGFRVRVCVKGIPCDRTIIVTGLFKELQHSCPPVLPLPLHPDSCPINAPVDSPPLPSFHNPHALDLYASFARRRNKTFYRQYYTSLLLFPTTFRTITTSNSGRGLQNSRCIIPRPY